ncbi:MAG: aminotransferase class IV [Pseudomonadota bacterium]
MENAVIPVNDHGLLYGDGVFEGLRFYNGRVFRYEQHMHRLAQSARAIGLRVPMSPDAIHASVQATILAAGRREGYVRLVVTRGSGSMGIDTLSCHAPRTIVIVDELTMVSAEKRQQGVACIIASSRRLGPDQLDPRIKSLNYLNQIMGRMEAQAAGADEAIVLNTQGRVAEGTADNVFIVQGGELQTPPVTEGALDGITRGAIIEVAISLGIPVTEKPMGTWDLFNADECFLSGTGAELIPVATIAGRSTGGAGPVFKRLATGFTQLIERETTGREPGILC